MKDKLTKIANLGLILLILLSTGSLIFTHFKVQTLSFLGAIVFVFLLLIICSKIPTIISEQKEKKYFAVLLFLLFLKELVVWTCVHGFSLWAILNPFFVVLFGFFICQFYQKITTFKETLMTLLLPLCFPISLWLGENFFSFVFLLLPLASLYVYTFLDTTTLARKRNYFLFVCFGFFLFLAINWNFLASFTIFVLFLNLYQNTKRIYTYRFLGTTLLSCLLCFACFFVLSLLKVPFAPSFNYQLNFSLFPFGKDLGFSSFFLFVLFILLFLGALSSCLRDKKQTFKTLLFATFLSFLACFLLQTKIEDLLPIITLFLLLAGNSIEVFLKNQVRYTKIHHLKKPPVIENACKVSVVIPNYNYANYILERIDSVLNQTYPIEELLILDDCSTDESVSIITSKIKEIQRDYPHLKVQFLPNKKNSGNVFKQWQKAFEVSKGDYLWIAEADDSCSNQFLSNVMKGFEDKKVVLSYCESLTMNEKNQILMRDLREWIDIFKTEKWNHSYIEEGQKEIKEALCINNTIANVSSVVFKKDKKIDFIKYLKGAQAYHLAGDWYFYLKVLAHGKIAYCKKALNYHRMHESSVTLTTSRIFEYQEIVDIQEGVKKEYQLSKETLKKIEKRRAWFQISDEELRLTKMDFNQIIKRKHIKDETLLSIIVPVYNTEPYLEKCLQSLLQYLPPQTEILIINDGSPDNADVIIQKYQEKYKDVIRSIRKENGGLSDTKNVGIKNAKGKYIGFVDSDDWIQPNMFSCLLKKALLEDLDLVFCDVNLVYEDGTTKYYPSLNQEEKDPLMQKLNTPLMAASWSKIVKKDLFKGLEYPKGYNNEDVSLSPILFARSQKTGYIASPFYQYFQRTGSIMNSTFSEKNFHIFYSSALCFERAKEFDLKTQEIIRGAIYVTQLLPTLCYKITAIERKKEREKYMALFCDKMNQFDDYETNPYVKEFLQKHHIEELKDALRCKDISKMKKILKYFDHG